MDTSHDQPVRKAAVALIVGALITAVGGATAQIIAASTSVSDELWRYPWSSETFAPVSLLWALAHALVIVGLLGLRRSGVTGPTRSATVGLTLAVAGTALLFVAEFASLPFADRQNDETGPMIVGAVYGVATLLSGIGLLLAGSATLRARRWTGWRRVTPIVAGGWTLILTGVATTGALQVGIAIYGLCLLAIGIALYTRPVPSTQAGGARERAVGVMAEHAG